jgi:hypothetical protein
MSWNLFEYVITSQQHSSTASLSPLGKSLRPIQNVLDEYR